MGELVAMTSNGSNRVGERVDVDSSRVGPLTTDELFAVLSRPGNRYVLTYVLLEGEAVSIVDLVEYVLDETTPPAEMTRPEYGGRLLHRFIETTLPELADHGLLEYDRRAQMVSETDATALTLPYLRAGLEQATRKEPERGS